MTASIMLNLLLTAQLFFIP